MMHYRNPAHVELVRQFPHRLAGGEPQQVKNAPPGRMSEGVEDRGHVVDGRRKRGTVGSHMSIYFNIFTDNRKWLVARRQRGTP